MVASSLQDPPTRSLLPPLDACRPCSAASGLTELTLKAGKWVRDRCGTEAYSAASQCYCPWAQPRLGPLERRVLQLHRRCRTREQPLRGPVHSSLADRNE
ncbi:hypothetical protein MDA_GLEAN10002633 [Myotis davidii]|uniref:Uncharacterized protein n=1 Tax=Myotis davidii TaxID=225400 RepID=L5LUN3_MYODS|nr:hypothetical protein MDA_GLEAN10002633 [Myotis davidii]